MEIYHKYFVSQHFGKSFSSVELGKDSGTVSLTLTRPEARIVTFSFQPARLKSILSVAEPAASMATRIAVQQAHRLFVHDGLSAFDNGELVLALDTPPWIGDLTDAPYGGATAGYESHVAAAAMSAAAGNTALRPA